MAATYQSAVARARAQSARRLVSVEREGAHATVTLDDPSGSTR